MVRGPGACRERETSFQLLIRTSTDPNSKWCHKSSTRQYDGSHIENNQGSFLENFFTNGVVVVR